MQTSIIDIYSESDRHNIDIVGKLLKGGGIAAIPTETVYGLAASIYDESALKNIFTAKGRPQNNPLIVHISDIDMLAPLVSEIPDIAYKLAERFWAGPLTLVLKKSSCVSDTVTAGLDTVAVRMPANKMALAIIDAAGVPLAAPSANLSGKPSPTTAKFVIDDLLGKVDCVVRSGDCTGGIESTVLSLADSKPVLLRPGAVTPEALREFLPDLVIHKAVTENYGGTAPSPGMMHKHYAPTTPLFLVDGDDADFLDYVNSMRGAIAVICNDETKPEFNCEAYSLGELDDEEGQASRLYLALRELDKGGFDAIYAKLPDASGGISLAMFNRLIRAADFRVIKLPAKEV